jgi:WD40 repeat protein
MRCVLALMAVVLGLMVPPWAPAQEAGEVAKLIDQLGSDDAAARKEAMKRLEEVGEPALEALRKAARDHADADVRLRAQLVVGAIEVGPFAELKVIGGQAGYWLNRVAFTRDGKQVVATGGAVIWYDPEQGKELRRVMERQYARRGFALSSDGKFFLTSHQSDPVARLGEVETGKEVQTFTGHTGGIHDVALAPDAGLAATAGADNTVRIWEVKTGKELRQAKGQMPSAGSLAFSPDGKRLASGHAGTTQDNCQVRLWDVETGKEQLALKGHTLSVTGVRFLSDGKSLLSASLDGTLRLWDAQSGKELKKLEHGGGVYDLAVSPDGKRALSAGWEDRTVRLWDLEAGKELHRFEGHQARVLGVAFSPDGKRAASSDANCTVRVWRLAK